MKKLSEQLLGVVEAAEPKLCKISEADSTHPIKPGGWSSKQILGHLIDSASNNHQRFVRASLQESLDFPAYDQDGNIRVQVVAAGLAVGCLQSLPRSRNRPFTRRQTRNSLPHRYGKAGHVRLPGNRLRYASAASFEAGRGRGLGLI
jgi:hypothetical protein